MILNIELKQPGIHGIDDLYKTISLVTNVVVKPRGNNRIQEEATKYF